MEKPGAGVRGGVRCGGSLSCWTDRGELMPCSPPARGDPRCSRVVCWCADESRIDWASLGVRAAVRVSTDRNAERRVRGSAQRASGEGRLEDRLDVARLVVDAQVELLG